MSNPQSDGACKLGSAIRAEGRILGGARGSGQGTPPAFDYADGGDFAEGSGDGERAHAVASPGFVQRDEQGRVDDVTCQMARVERQIITKDLEETGAEGLLLPKAAQSFVCPARDVRGASLAEGADGLIQCGRSEEVTYLAWVRRMAWRSRSGACQREPFSP